MREELVTGFVLDKQVCISLGFVGKKKMFSYTLKVGKVLITRSGEVFSGEENKY